MNQIDTITKYVGLNFPSFGGGQIVEGNPIAVALKDGPFQFAAGVNVREVITAIFEVTNYDGLYEACKRAIRIKRLWCPEDMIDNVDEGVALWAMHDYIEAALAKAEEKQ